MLGVALGTALAQSEMRLCVMRESGPMRVSCARPTSRRSVSLCVMELYADVTAAASALRSSAAELAQARQRVGALDAALAAAAAAAAAAQAAHAEASSRAAVCAGGACVCVCVCLYACLLLVLRVILRARPRRNKRV